MYFPYSFWSNSRISKQNLIAYYKLNNNGNDSHGTNHLSNNGSVVYSDGKINSSLRTADDTIYLYHTSNSNFQIITNKTFAFWYRPHDSASDICLSKFSDGESLAEYYFSKETFIEPFSIGFYVYTTNTVKWVISTNSLYINSWNLIIGWVDIDNLLIWIQVNNGVPSSTSLAGEPPTTSNTDFVLGGNNTASVGGNNSVDEVSIWNRILTESERNILWNNGNGLSYPFS